MFYSLFALPQLYSYAVRILEILVIAQSISSGEITKGGAKRITLSRVSLANNPSLAKALQKRRAPPASGCN